MSAAASSGTNQRLTLDDSSFEKLLAAAWVLQCLHDQLHPWINSGGAVERAEPLMQMETARSDLHEVASPVVQLPPMVTEAESQPAGLSPCTADDESFAELIKTQEAIEAGILDLDATVKRLLSLSPRVSSEPAPLEPVPAEPVQVKVTPLELKPKLQAQPEAVVLPTKPSPIWQKPTDNEKPATHVSSFNLGATLLRFRDALGHYRTNFRLDSALRVVHSVTIATSANLQPTCTRLRDAFARYRATFLRRTDKAWASHALSFDLGTTLTRLRDAFTQHVSNFRVNFTLRSLRAVAIATPVWLLAVIANLLLLATWLHEPFQGGQAMSIPSPSTAEASVTVNAPTRTVSTRSASQPPKRIERTEPRRPTTISPLAAAHEQITDPATSSVVEQLSRYEINGLRRQAKYGDESAAFTLGMAFEIGRYLRQNCAEAARWVRTAAEEGNAAAEYNLGLRYRDGDGVPADRAESEKWLRKAAAQRNRDAKLALNMLASR
jgi:hypothetical protein